MVRRQTDSEPARWATLILLLMDLVSCSLVYVFMTVALRPGTHYSGSKAESFDPDEGEPDQKISRGGSCCRGIQNLELWGVAVKWSSDFKFNSSEECCGACKKLCTGNDGPCLSDSWVFCGNLEACGHKFW